MQPWPPESTNRSRSGQWRSDASNFSTSRHRTVATSAAPIGRPGWPLLAFSTASRARKRIAFAIASWDTLVAPGDTVVVAIGGLLGSGRRLLAVPGSGSGLVGTERAAARQIGAVAGTCQLR